MAESRNVSLLINAFDTFKKASTTLEGYYTNLQKKIDELNIELAENNNHLKTIIEGMPVGIVVISAAGIIETVNSNACAIMEECHESLRGKGMDDTVRMTGRPLSDLIRNGEYEFVFPTSQNRKKTISVVSTILKGLQGQGKGYLVVLKDISEMKRLEESAQRDKRLRAMGEMAAGIAHQIRNPLGSIELFASMLVEDLAGDRERQRFAGEIIQAVKSLNNTISNMLLFANVSVPSKNIVSAEDMIGETLGICRFLYHEKAVRIETSFCEHGDTLFVYGDRDLLKQAILNIIMNAVDAVDGKDEGTVTVDARQDADKVRISISDNGCGISDSDIENVFDPFFTKKPGGTGLGLAVASNVVKAHGGSIEVKSSPENGTVFEIILPANPAKAGFGYEVSTYA